MTLMPYPMWPHLIYLLLPTLPSLTHGISRQTQQACRNIPFIPNEQYNQLVQVLPANLTTSVIDSVENPPTVYSQLKNAFLGRVTLDPKETLTTFMKGIITPSLFLRRLWRHFDDTNQVLTDDYIKSILITSLPLEIRLAPSLATIPNHYGCIYSLQYDKWFSEQLRT